MTFGYCRVSRPEQNTSRQEDILLENGCERIFMEKITGTKKNRPELIKMLDYLREGDIVIVTELSRLGRNFLDLFDIIGQIEEKGANLKSLKEAWIDTTTSQGKLMFTIMAGLAQFERDLISDRTKEGLAAARARGRKGGRPPADPEKVKLALKMYDDKNFSLNEIKQASKISVPTIYKYLNLRNALSEKRMPLVETNKV